MGYYIGMMLAGLVRPDHQEGDVNTQGQGGVREAQSILLRIGREVS